MSQLSDPLSYGLWPFEKALHHLLHHARPCRDTPSLAIALHDSLSHITARDVQALHDVPSFDNAAVDGYGLTYKDLGSDTRVFPLGHTVYAGHEGTHAQGTASVIMTGASLPQGVDMVVMKEDVETKGDQVMFPEKSLERGMNVRYRGEDVEKGSLLLAKSSVLSPTDVALLASQGYDTVEVVRPPRVGLLSTGDEIVASHAVDNHVVDNHVVDNHVAAHHDLSFPKVRDANRPMLFSALKKMGYPYEDGGIVSDSFSLLEARLLSLCESCDVVITTGSMSVGLSDHMASLLKTHGQLYFHGVAMKPGRPFGFGKIGSAFLCGLPGNPVAAYTCFLSLVVPFLRKLRGHPSPLNVSRETLRADFDYKKRKGMREFVRVVVDRDENGHLVGKKYGKSGAAMISSLSQASGFAMISEDYTHTHKGHNLPFLSFKDLLS